MAEFNFDDIELVKGAQRCPQLSVIYGKGGLGKSTLSSYATDPVIIPVGLETGHERMEVPKLLNKNKIDDLEFAFGAMKYIIEKPHTRKTLIIDNVGTFRECVDADVIAKNPDTGGKNGKKAESLSDYGYGKGVAMAFPYWIKLLKGIDKVMRSRDMDVILLAHPVLYNINNEDGSYYQRIGINAPAGENTNVRGLLEARAHNVFYIDEVVPTSTVKTSFGGDKKVATSSATKRIIYTKPQGNFFAKSRVNMDRFYIIENSQTEEELLKDRTNQSIIDFWADFYK